jgi:hypothetical protein
MAHQCPVDTHWLADRFLVALPPDRDLLLCAKYLFVAAMAEGLFGGEERGPILRLGGE